MEYKKYKQIIDEEFEGFDKSLQSTGMVVFDKEDIKSAFIRNNAEFNFLQTQLYFERKGYIFNELKNIPEPFFTAAVNLYPNYKDKYFLCDMNNADKIFFFIFA